MSASIQSSTASIGTAILGESPVKVLVSLSGNTPTAIEAALARLNESDADIIEWRADTLGSSDPFCIVRQLAAIRTGTRKPLLFTLRTALEGGSLDLSDMQYGAIVSAVIQARLADAVDVEIRRAGASGLIAMAHERAQTVIASFHDFGSTPEERTLLSILSEMASCGADVLKMALMPRSPDDVIALLALSRKARERFAKPQIMISMGATGMLSRLAGCNLGNDATFACIGEPSAPGQIEISQLRQILGLLDPVGKF